MLLMPMRTSRTILVAAGALGLLALVYCFGAASIAAVLTHVTWWQFVLICLVHSLNVVVDSYGWRYAIAGDGAPFHRLVAARCAGDAVNAVTAVAAVGGELTKAWLLRHDLAYRESVPSLIVAKTAEVLSQALLLALGVVLAWTTAAVAAALRAAMLYLLVFEVIGAGGFLGVQVAGAVGKAGRVLTWIGGRGQRLRIPRRRGPGVRPRPPRLSGSVDRRGRRRPHGHASGPCRGSRAGGARRVRPRLGARPKTSWVAKRTRACGVGITRRRRTAAGEASAAN